MNNCRALRVYWLVFVVSLALSADAVAQITTGTISGSVEDSQGGRIPGATVTLISEARGTRSTPVVTGTDGDYVIPNVTPDRYTLEVVVDGFKTLQRTRIRCQRRRSSRPRPLAIEVGGKAETVNVIAEAALVQAQSGERSFTVTTTEVENLPLSNRNFASLAALGPGRGRHAPHRRWRTDELHHGRRVGRGHRQQRPDAAD